MGDDGAEEHLVGLGDFVSSKRRSDHVGADHGDDGEFLVAEGFFFGGDLGFTVFELAFPTIEVGLDATALALAKVVEFKERAVFFAVIEGGLDHGAGGRGDPDFGRLEGKVADLEWFLAGEEGEGERPFAST